MVCSSPLFREWSAADEPTWEPAMSAASTVGGGLKLGKPVGGVDGPCGAAGCALNEPDPPVDAAWVGLWPGG